LAFLQAGTDGRAIAIVSLLLRSMADPSSSQISTMMAKSGTAYHTPPIFDAQFSPE
jgi:hypothetical protein